MKRYTERIDHAGHLFETENGEWVKFEDVRDAINKYSQENMDAIYDAYREGEHASSEGLHWDESISKVRYQKLNETRESI